MEQPLNPPISAGPASFEVQLAGRYWAMLSMLPLFLAGIIGLYLAVLLLVSWLLGSAAESFFVILLPFLSGVIFLSMMLGTALWILHWHGRRTMEILPEGILLTVHGREPVFVRWADLRVVELRYARPSVVHCTLRTPFWELSFSNLDLNLVGRVAFTQVFAQGFRVDRMRQFLQLLNKMSPRLEWRMGASFQLRYQILSPPYDLEHMV
jgi:hypothetical protein